MTNPGAIRGWLWRLDAVLALAVGALGVKLVLGTPRVPDVAPDPAPRRAPLSAQAPDPDAVRLERFLQLVARLHKEEPPAPSLPSPSSPATPLPLGAYRALLWVRDLDGPDHVTLKSKDPARPESLLFIEGDARNGLLLAKVEEDGDVVRFLVHRATEEHAYELRPWTRTGGGPIRELPMCASAPGDGAEFLASIRAVPFQGPTSRGLRVTGVRRGSAFHTAGLRRGDVVVAAGAESTSTLDELRRALRDGRGAATLLLQSLDGSETRTIQVVAP